MNRIGPKVSDYYDGKTIFITGGSGFIGKVLIWKLLQSCSNLDTIYLLMRRKGDEDVQLRVEELFKTPIFDDIKRDKVHLLDKVKAITGDVSEENLGLSEEDEQTVIDSVHIIFHNAAVLNFKLNLKEAVNTNVEGTKRLLDLATKMRKLEALVYTSTAFCHCDIPELEEKLYKTRETPNQVMELVRWMKPDLLELIQDEIIKPHPNTYTYTKRLAETVVGDYFPQLPCVIARPAIVMPSQTEPIPGWVDNINGVMGMLVGVAKGVLRVVWANIDCHGELISVDVTCNALITTAWKIGKDTQRPKDLPVYNLGSMEMKRITYKEFWHVWHKLGHVYPYSVAFGHPGVSTHDNYYIYTLQTILWQWIPAIVVDALLFVFGHKMFMIRVQKKVQTGIKVLAYFCRREWYFVKKNILQVREELLEEDRRVFKLTNANINVEDYFLNMTRVARWYIMKDDLANLPTARRRYKMFLFLHYFLTAAFWFCVAWIFVPRLFYLLTRENHV